MKLSTFNTKPNTRAQRDVLFLYAAEHFEKDKRQNRLDEHIREDVSIYQFRKEEPRYSCGVSMEEIAGNDFNLNISRYISTAVAEKEVVWRRSIPNCDCWIRKLRQRP